MFCCVCVGSRDPRWLHQSLDDIHSGSNAPVPHLTQVFGVGVGEVGEKGDDQRREEIGRVDEAAQHQAEGGQNGEESVAGGQTEVLLGHAPEEEALQAEEDDQDGVDQLFEVSLREGEDLEKLKTLN